MDCGAKLSHLGNFDSIGGTELWLVEEVIKAKHRSHNGLKAIPTFIAPWPDPAPPVLRSRLKTPFFI